MDLTAHAVVLATRNRPTDVERTLRSVARAEGSNTLRVVLVDGSDPDKAQTNQRVLRSISSLHVDYHPFPGDPAASRQCNYGVEVLPASIRVVHFIDDDVEVHPRYFVHLAQTLRDHPEAGGVAGQVHEPERPSPPVPTWARRFFLLDGLTPGAVLPSGHVVPLRDTGQVAPVQWISGCACAYRRSVFERHRFDSDAVGRSPRLEDLDFSYRVGQTWPLLFQPKAVLDHYPSSANRRELSNYATERIICRYWFVRKNLYGPMHIAAFWWATLGQTLALAASSSPNKWMLLRGHLRGIRRVRTRSHPLLRHLRS